MSARAADAPRTPHTHTGIEREQVHHTWLDFIWLGALALCNLAPFIAIRHLFETRRNCHVALRCVGWGVWVCLLFGLLHRRRAADGGRCVFGRCAGRCSLLDRSSAAQRSTDIAHACSRARVLTVCMPVVCAQVAVVCDDPDDPIAHTLRRFLSLIGHLAVAPPSRPQQQQKQQPQQQPEEEKCVTFV